jgi:hypothetical protein
MPVTAKLSRRFYETFGDELANELVEWFNQVDATYRAHLKELNELNFARFDAKLEQRVAELRADMDGRFAQMRADMDGRFAQAKADLREAIAGLDGGVRASFGTLEGRLLARIGVLDGRFGTLEGRLWRWTIASWVGTVGALAALLKL